MKIFLVLIVCCGITIAHNAKDVCKAADTEIGSLIKTTNANAAAMVLWNLQKFGKALKSLPAELGGYDELLALMEGQAEELTLYYTSASIQMLNIFDGYHEETSGVDGSMTVHDFEKLDEEASGIGFFFDYMKDKSKGFRYDLSPFVSTNSKKIYLKMNNLIGKFLGMSLKYKSKVIDSYKKLGSKLEYVWRILDDSAFGGRVIPLLMKYGSILEVMKSLIESKWNAVTPQDKTSDIHKAIILQAVLTKMYYIHDIEDAHSTFGCIAAALKNSDKTDIEQLSPPDNAAIQATCNSLNLHILLLDQLATNINELSEKHVSYPIFLKKIFNITIQMESNRPMVVEQFTKILNAAGILINNTYPFIETEEIDRTFIERALMQNGSNYAIGYAETGDQIHQRILQNGHYPLQLIRMLWQKLARKLYEKCDTFNVDGAPYANLAIIIQKLQFVETTRYLSTARINKDQYSLIKFDTLVSIEKAVTSLIIMLDEISDNNFITFGILIYDSAQSVFCSIQLAIYQFYVVLGTAPIVALDKDSALNAAVDRFDGLLDQLNESDSHGPVRDAIKPFVVEFEAISSKFQSLIDLHTILSAESEKNPMKLAFVHFSAHITVPACDFITVSKVLSYVAKMLNRLDCDAYLGQLNLTRINERLNILKMFNECLQNIITFIEAMCAENAVVPTNMEEVIKGMSRSLSQLNDVYFLRRELIKILEALPSPLKTETALNDAFIDLSAAIEFKSNIASIEQIQWDLDNQSIGSTGESKHSSTDEEMETRKVEEMSKWEQEEVRKWKERKDMGAELETASHPSKKRKSSQEMAGQRNKRARNSPENTEP